ncbi:DUF1302 family protein [Fontimonas sp. SYSU GA230001]|uniref:DUF1302 domain-containing protein n=1 Tax=Fontimonas sp. SYSU GA230001 TaxID=3142450 RepID=UPI0032B3FFB3
MSKWANRRIVVSAAAAMAALYGAAAQAVSFSLPWGEDASIDGVLNTTITVGASMRMQERHTDYLGKANINPDVCGGINQSCQGLFRDQGHPGAALAAAPGQFSPNYDDGNWNYDRYDLTSGVAKITQDLTLTYDNFGLFVKGLYYYDWVNARFDEYHPNLITRANKDSVGTTDTTFGDRQYGPGRPEKVRRRNGSLLGQIGTELQLLDSYFFGTLPLWGEQELSFKVGRQAINWGESTLLALNSINQANPVNASNFYRVGFLVEEVFTPVGMISASFEPFSGGTFEAFYQYEWLPVEAPAPGSMLQLSDTVGTDNAVNYAYVHFGGGAEDPDGVGYPLFNPLSGVTNTTTKIDRLRDLEPKDGGQYGVSFKYYAENLNNGTEFGFYYMNYHSRLPYASFFATAASCARREGNALGIDAYDPISFLAACPDLPVLAQATGGDTALSTSNAVPLDTVKLLVEYPEDIKLYGISFNTTAFGWSFQGEVAYRPNLPLQVDTEDLVFAAFGPTLSRCHDPNLQRSLIPAGALGNALGQTNLIFGAVSQLTGGIVGIPNLVPVGVNGCSGTTAGVGAYVDNGYDTATPLGGGEGVYAPSDYVVDGNGTPGAFRDTFDLAIGHAPGSARSFPAFVTAYRGTQVGENAPCSQEYIYDNAIQQTTGYGAVNRDAIASGDASLNPNFIPYTPSNPCYIRGYERLEVYQFNFGGTQVLGATDNPIGADQIQFVFETGATWVPNLPPLDLLQFEAAGTYSHASAGADGTGAYWTSEREQRLACSYDPVTRAPRQSCSYGIDGLRFNPSQANLDLYPDKFSWGYVLIAIIKYESILPGISMAPQIIWKHDVNGTAPGPGENFIAGRKTADIQLETRYKSNFGFYLGYTWYTGGGIANLYRDKDMARAFVKVQF